MSKNKYLLGISLCMLSAVAWGGAFPFMAFALKVMDPFYISLLRFGPTALFFTILLLIREGPKAFKMEGHFWKLWLLGGFAIVGFSFLVFLGQKLAGAQGVVITSVLMATQPLLGVLIMRIYRGTKPTAVTLLSMVVALLGIVMVVTKGNVSHLLTGNNILFAIVLILIGALCWAAYTIVGIDFSSWSVLRFTTLTYITGMLTAIVIIAIVTAVGLLKVPTWQQVSAIWLDLAYLIVPGGIIALFTWNLGNRLASPVNGILTYNLVPITALAMNVATGYKLSIFEIVGTTIVILALVANNVYQRGSRQKKTES